MLLQLAVACATYVLLCESCCILNFVIALEHTMSAGTLSPAVSDRETEIRSALKTMVDAKRRWSLSEDRFFPDWLENAISAALNIALNGDVPASCIKLHAACVRLADAWGSIITEGEGLDQKTGIPGRQFWALFESVEVQLKNSDSSRVRALTPVKQLMEEYKNDGGRKWMYIARDYGWLDKSGEDHIWKGPFFRNGNVDQFAIEQEAADPGSVVPAGWHPEDENEKMRKNIIADSGSALSRIRQHLKSQGKIQEDPEDPATIEELLRQGQFVSVIARVKKVSEQEVRAVAEKMKITALSKEDLYQKAQVEGAADDQIYRESMVGADDTSGGSGELMKESPSSPAETLSSDSPDSGLVDTPEISDEESNASESPDDLLAKLFESNPDIDTPRAMQALKTAGITITGQAVGRKLAAMRSSKYATIPASNESESQS
jgi:hypothetical protein